MTIQLGVDTAALYDLAGRLKGFQMEFDRAADVVDTYSYGMGYTDLDRALHEFADNWSDKRRQISDMIADVASCVANAADVYTEVEDSIAGGFGGGGGSGW